MSEAAAVVQLRREITVRGVDEGYVLANSPIDVCIACEDGSYSIRYTSVGGERRSLRIPRDKLFDRDEIYETEFPRRWGDAVL